MKSILSLANEPSSTISDECVEQASHLFSTHGALWIKDVFDPEFIDELADAYDKRYTSRPVSQLKKHYAIVGDHRFMISIRVEAPFDNPLLFDHPQLSSILRHWLGSQYVISSLGSVVTFAGADAQPIHFDHPPLFESEEKCLGLPPYAVTMVVPLVDLDRQTGSTAIWEGSHRSKGARKQLESLMHEPDWDAASVPLAKKGDVYFMDYRVIHGGTANRSEDSRPILYIVYSRPWFFDSFNFSDQPAIDITPAQLKSLPKPTRRLFTQRFVSQD